MKKGRSTVVLSLVAALALAVVAANAQAITIQPAGTAVTDSGTKSTMTYSSLVVTCATSTATATTSNPATGSLTETTTDSESGGCGTTVLFTAAGTSCTRTITWSVASGLGSGTGTIALATACAVTIGSGFCTIALAPQTSSSKPAAVFTASTTTLQVTANFAATRTGSAMCGPASGTLSYSGTYSVSPTNLTITNP